LSVHSRALGALSLTEEVAMKVLGRVISIIVIMAFIAIAIYVMNKDLIMWYVLFGVIYLCIIGAYKIVKKVVDEDEEHTK